MEIDSENILSLANLFLLLVGFDWLFFTYFFLLIVLIICSACISASEVAFFSLSPSNIRSLEEEAEDDKTVSKILELRKDNKKLLATILISNNFVNVAIVIVSQVILSQLLTPYILNSIGTLLSNYIFGNLFTIEQLAYGFYFFITVILVTLLLLLFGEVAPKIIANINNMKVARFMAGPLSFLSIVFNPLSSILVNWGSYIEDRIARNRSYQTGTSKEDLDHAIELTVNQDEEQSQDAEMLKGIVNFGDLSARQVMRSRVYVVAVEKNTPFDELLKIVTEAGYSRVPVYDTDFDNLIGILHIKDLIGKTKEKSDYDWLPLVRPSLMYIPETKKIDDLLRDFQAKKMHMAIVVDEFGGSLGIVTLEDIMEEVIGEINDETDYEDEIDYVKIGEGNYIFDGKTLLNDVCRIIGEKTSYFDDIKGNADSLGGLMVEILGNIPKPEKELTLKELKLKVVTSNARRIEKINLRTL